MISPQLHRLLLPFIVVSVIPGFSLAEDLLNQPRPSTAPAGINENLLDLFVRVPGATISQAGSNNRASITQSSGADNFSFIGTTGTGNEVTIIQQGEGHTAGAITIGNGSTVDVNQQGRDHRAAITVFGNNADISVTQKGASESVGIVQIGKGSPIDVKQGF
jgi:hypothetical protein